VRCINRVCGGLFTLMGGLLLFTRRMDFANFLIQLLNSVQYGLLLFMLAAGLTLIFGIMGVVNLAHGSFYMLGAYLAWSLAALRQPHAGHPARRRHRGGLRAAAGATAVPPLLPARPPRPGAADVRPDLRLRGTALHPVGRRRARRRRSRRLLAASIPLTDNLSYPVYRLFMSGVCIALALGLYLLISKTRLGMKIRAGAFNHDMAEALGINIKRSTPWCSRSASAWPPSPA
jgi:branched-chain amino acid transport system permease protein